ncbi:MAG: thiol-disulfide oxidoreductase DCC family protein [Oligoflexales bacterium]
MSKKKPLMTAYYDGSCPLCEHEMQVYKNLDRYDRLKLMDISAVGFDPTQEGLDPKLVNKFFHIKSAKNELCSGVDAFVQIWETLEIFPYGIWCAKNRVIRPLMNVGYLVFANLRPYLPKKKCDDQCHMR